MSIYISEYVSYNEVTHSPTALRKNIKNEPNIKQLRRIRLLCIKVFDPLREWVGGPIKVNSVFRSEKLNRIIGGSSKSQHLANKGAAIDIDDTYGYKSNLEMFYYIKNNIEFDQLIVEFPINGKPKWLHISYNKDGNRNQILIATKINQRTKYLLYDDNKHLVSSKDC